MKNIRNFCIIAHIDHGKSTLADRLLDFTGSVTDREKQDQLLDNMDLERERGITIKSHAIQMEYTYKGEEYILNLIDTPGHVDFSYEVSRSLKAVEGAILLVDATVGIQAQTLANLYLAMAANLSIIPVINKIDLPHADVGLVKSQLIDLLGVEDQDILSISAKTGVGVEQIFPYLVDKIPAPSSISKDKVGLVFDSYFDDYQGVVVYIRVCGCDFKKGDNITF